MLYVCCTNIIFYMLTISSINYVSNITGLIRIDKKAYLFYFGIFVE